MANLVAAHGAQLVDASLGTTTLTATTTPLHIRLMTANGSATAAGTELATGGSYTAVTGIATTGSGFAAANTTTATAATNAALTQTNMPVSTIVGIEIWDSTGTPARKWFGALTASKTLAAGDTFSIATGALTVQDI